MVLRAEVVEHLLTTSSCLPPVVAGGLVAAQANDQDDVQGSIAAPVESVSDGSAADRLPGGGADSAEFH